MRIQLGRIGIGKPVSPDVTRTLVVIKLAVIVLRNKLCFITLINNSNQLPTNKHIYKFSKCIGYCNYVFFFTFLTMWSKPAEMPSFYSSLLWSIHFTHFSGLVSEYITESKEGD